MEILKSGSFINTDNQEKIERLKFTATELANAAVTATGFVNDEEAGKKLALDFWQGLEYMCRDAGEEATIKNIFLSHFLERLGQLRTTDNTAANYLSDDSKAEDEFLGVLAETSEEDEDEETIIAEEAKAIMEESCRRTEDPPASANESAENEERETADTVLSELKTEPSETLKQETSETNKPNLDDTTQEKIVSEALQLPEKEPYQFDKCLVTATIQLLPADSGNRRAVLSVRTHDFPPQISVREFTGEANSANLLSALDEAFEKYKTDLPVKVMEKLKKEKNGTKKKTNKRSVKSETKEVATNKSEESNAVSDSEVKTGENETPNVIIPKPEMSVQGSLFG